MNKIRDLVRSVAVFVQEVFGEVRRCSWPERDELMSSTTMVIISLLLLSMVVGISDWVLVKFVRWLVGRG